MGLNESIQNSKQLINLQYYADIQNQQYGKISIYKHEDIFLQKVNHIADDQNQLESQMTVLKIFLRQQKHFQKIFSIRKSKQITCRKDFQIYTLSNYYSFTLKDLIDRKNLLKSSFTEAELWYILKSIAESGAFLQKKGLIIGDIRPQTIFLSHQHNIRIPVLGILPNCMNSNFFKSFIGFKQGCFFSPEQLFCLKNSIQTPNWSHYKSDVFSLGITLLECITKCPSNSNYYQYNNFAINDKKIKKTLAQLQDLCSPKILQVLKMMLKFNQDQRIDFKKLKIWIEQKNSEIQDTYILNIQEKQIINTTVTQIPQHVKEKKKISLKR